MPDPAEFNSSVHVEAFVELLARSDQALTAYVMSLVPSSTDAEDILQETKVALWRSFDRFQGGTDFSAWARKTALNRILDYRKRKARERQHIWFSEKCYELLADDFESDIERLQIRTDRLRHCIAKLQPQHRRILTLRYFRDASVEDVAARVQRTVGATYRALSRIRLALRECMTGAAE